MDFFQAQDVFKKLYVGKEVTFDFDDKCQRQHEVIYSEGNPHLVHHVECNQVRVKVEGMDYFYVPISPHRMNISWNDMKSLIAGKDDVHINHEELKSLKDLQEKDNEQFGHYVSEIARLSGMDVKKIQEKIENFKE